MQGPDGRREEARTSASLTRGKAASSAFPFPWEISGCPRPLTWGEEKRGSTWVS